MNSRKEFLEIKYIRGEGLSSMLQLTLVTMNSRRIEKILSNGNPIVFLKSTNFETIVNKENIEEVSFYIRNKMECWA